MRDTLRELREKIDEAAKNLGLSSKLPGDPGERATEKKGESL